MNEKSPPAMTSPHVSILILSTNACHHLPECLASMSRQTYPNYTLYVIDNHSTDGTQAYVREHFPHVKLLTPPDKVCYRTGNQYGIEQMTSPYVMISNEDVEVEPNWLEELVRCMEADPQIGIATPKILRYDQRDRINAAGNTLHYTGLASNRGNGEPAHLYDTPEDVATISGCCFLMRRELLDEVRGFSMDFNHLEVGYFASFEDVDLSWRTRLAGWRIRYVPSAVMYHKWVAKDMGPGRFTSYEWGRLLVILRNFSLSTLLLLAPALALVEAMTWSYAIARGRPWIWGKLRVWGWLLSHPQLLWQMRRKVQALRRVSDRQLLEEMSPTLTYAYVLKPKLLAEALNLFSDTLFRTYRKALLRVL